MASSYRALVDDREFLNLPGFHGSAVVNAYVEDTSERELQLLPGMRARNIEPRVILELSDCSRRVSYELAVHSDVALENSLHKLGVMIAVLQHVADALLEEAFKYQERQELIDRHNAELPIEDVPF